MEDYLYLIVGAIWLIISSLRGKKKKDQPKRRKRPSAGEDPIEEIQTIFEEFLGNKENEPVHEPSIPQSSKETFVKPSPVEETVSHLEKESEEFSPSGLAPIEEEPTTTENDFDLREAIIYSEILKRPEY